MGSVQAVTKRPTTLRLDALALERWRIPKARRRRPQSGRLKSVKPTDKPDSVHAASRM